MVEVCEVPSHSDHDRPSVAGPRRRCGFAVALALTLGVSGMTAIVTPTMASAQAADRDPNALEGQFVAGVNALRTSQGLAQFIADTEIRTVAMGWTEKMAAAGAISHNPNLAKEITASWRKLGENVGTGPDVASVEEAFENSPGHRRNLLDPEFTHVSITVVVRGDRIFVTQQFRTPSAQAAASAPTGVPTELALAVVSKPVATSAKSARSVRSVRSTKTGRASTRRPVRATTRA